MYNAYILMRVFAVNVTSTQYKTTFYSTPPILSNVTHDYLYMVINVEPAFNTRVYTSNYLEYRRNEVCKS